MTISFHEKGDRPGPWDSSPQCLMCNPGVETNSNKEKRNSGEILKKKKKSFKNKDNYLHVIKEIEMY